MYTGDTEMDFKETGLQGGMQSINQSLDRDKWWALVNTVKIHGLQQEAEDSLNI
jgi:hypothetical protein